MYNLLLFHFVISLIYFLYWLRNKKQLGFWRLVLVCTIPLFGCIYVFFVEYINKSKKHSQDALNFDEGTDGNNDMQFIKKIDIDKDMNIIPMEEALILNKSSVKRVMVVDMIKKDIFKHIDLLKKALKDEDTETSHYAATAITEIKRELTLYIQDLLQKYNDNKTDEEVLTAFADTLKKYINSGLLDSFNHSKYLELYQEVLNNLLSINSSKPKYFVDIINCCIERSQFDKAEELCDRFRKLHPGSERSYLMKLKLCYVLKNNEKFSQTLKEMKMSNLKLSNKGLNIIRFWSEVR